MLRDEGAAAERLARLLGTSRYATDLLMRAPEATAMLAHDDDLASRDGDALASEARRAAQRRDDPVEAITATRAIRRRELFRTAAADIFGLIEVDAVGRAVSAIARATLEGGLAAASRRRRVRSRWSVADAGGGHRHGAPRRHGDVVLERRGCVVRARSRARCRGARGV
ncbi:MAG: hypothetical protein WKF76_02555 [Nocardioidaceae bacterium]